MNFNPWTIMGSILFSGIGGVALAFGRKKEVWQLIALGIVLMVYPMFLDGWLFWLAGVVLTALCFKDWEE